MRRDNSICVTTTQKDRLSATDAFALLDTVGVPTSSLQAVQALNQTSFDVTFRTLRDRKLYAGKLAQLDCVDVRVYGSAESIITASRIPDEFDDNYVRNYLSRFGQVLASRMVTYRDRPSVRNGNRQYKVVLKPGVNVPSSWRLADGRLVFFSYVGQVRTCIKCYQEGHEAANCTVRFCNKCQTVGHIASDCTNDIVCNNCNKEGHTARRCPTSYANKLQLENKWTKGPEAVVDKSTCSSGVPVQVEQTESETVAHDSPMSQGQDPDEQDNSEEESADSSEEDTEEKMELILTPSPGNESDSTQPKAEAQSKTSRRKNRRRNKVRGKNNEPPNQNNEIEQAVTHELMAKETGVKKTTISETTGTSSDEKDPEFTGMEVGKMTAKRPAASTRSDDEVSRKRKANPSSKTVRPTDYDLPLAEDLQIEEFESSEESL
ncbi:zinc finger protein [Branchiostoma belcheri]|nr:zinc finger protein [Branchiostoma belcheri]